jgi:hypothetical protein
MASPTFVRAAASREVAAKRMPDVGSWPPRFPPAASYEWEQPVRRDAGAFVLT